MGEYRDFMIQKLGPENYDALRDKANATYPLELAKKDFMSWYAANYSDLIQKYPNLRN